MQLCPGFARQCALETAWAAPIPHNTPVVLIIPIAPITPIKIFAVLYCGMIAFWVSEGRFWQKNSKKKCEKNLAVDEKGRTFALAFREWRRRHASRGAEKLNSVKHCPTFWQRQKSAVTLQTLSGRKNAFRDTRKNEHIERITIDKVVVRELKKNKLESILNNYFYLIKSKRKEPRTPHDGTGRRKPKFLSGSSGGRHRQQTIIHEFVCLDFWKKIKKR